jgi:hypothetical protein
VKQEYILPAKLTKARRLFSKKKTEGLNKLDVKNVKCKGCDFLSSGNDNNIINCIPQFTRSRMLLSVLADFTQA